MTRTHLATVLIVVAAASATSVAYAASKAATDTDKKEAEARYVEDKKLCSEETSSSLRMQCLRDAKDEYRKALAADAPSSKDSTGTAAICADCGKVTGVRVVEKKGKSTPLGLIAGGVAGAVLGHQVGEGRGKEVATLAGAAGGAYAGHKIEESARSTKSWVVSVQFDNGDRKDFNFDADPGYTAGDAVKLSGNGIVRH